MNARCVLGSYANRFLFTVQGLGNSHGSWTLEGYPFLAAKKVTFGCFLIDKISAASGNPFHGF